MRIATPAAVKPIKSFLIAYPGSPISLSSTSRFDVLSGYLEFSTTTEAPTQAKLYDYQHTARNLRCYVVANTRDGDSTIALRDDGADALTLTIPASTTGAFENTASVAIAAGSLCNYRAIMGGSTGMCSIHSIQVDMVIG